MFLKQRGFETYECASEDEARDRADELIAQKKWPCYFFKSDTTGEKDFEEFFTNKETLDMTRFDSVGIIKNAPGFDVSMLQHFTDTLTAIKAKPSWKKAEMVDLFNGMISDFAHKETGKYLDGRM